LNLLLDTHVFIWWESEPEKLSPTSLEALQDGSNTIQLSLVSIWEMQIKAQLGKIAFDEPLEDKVARQRLDNHMQLLSLREAHIYALSNLAGHHRDPFDRLLIAQANVESMTLVTTDKHISHYSVPTLW